uniref:Uncharacterized protein n=1 Tax=Coccidioides posadasii RMSCC 3488 TaxID=454284 RepID=A0A0J6EUI7_COCPO|nr:hypothetical protein CPAG_00538 [Coccidioides posadasii RMSCC 3488]
MAANAGCSEFELTRRRPPLAAPTLPQFQQKARKTEARVNLVTPSDALVWLERKQGKPCGPSATNSGVQMCNSPQRWLRARDRPWDNSASLEPTFIRRLIHDWCSLMLECHDHARINLRFSISFKALFAKEVNMCL